MNLIAFDVGAQLQASNQYPSALGSLYFQLPGAAQRTYNYSLKEKLEYLHYMALPSKKAQFPRVWIYLFILLST